MSSREPMQPEFCRIHKRSQESDDVFTLELDLPKKSGKARFTPGQFNMLYAFGVGEVAISISGDPQNQKRWVHTIRSVGATTRAISKLKAGDHLGVRGPYGTGWPVEEAKGNDIIFVAGGLGLAPLRPAIQHTIASRKKYGRITVLYGARSQRDLLFQKQIAGWKKANVEVLVAVSQADRKWTGMIGHVTSLIERIAVFPEKTTAFLCGPEIMMRFGTTSLQQRGVPASAIFLSMERNMKCAIGFCGHCQLGPAFICKDGPVLSYERLEPLMQTREL